MEAVGYGNLRWIVGSWDTCRLLDEGGFTEAAKGLADACCHSFRLRMYYTRSMCQAKG